MATTGDFPFAFAARATGVARGVATVATAARRSGVSVLAASSSAPVPKKQNC